MRQGEREMMQREERREWEVREMLERGVRRRGLGGDEIGNIMLLNNDS